MTTLLARYFSCCEALCAPSAVDIDELCGGNIEQDHSIFWDQNDENDDGLNKNPSSYSTRIAAAAAAGRVPGVLNNKPPIKSNAMDREEGKTAAGDDDELDKMLEDMGKQRYPRERGASDRFLHEESDTLYLLITCLRDRQNRPGQGL
jgi:hypothetical protein